MRLEAIAALLGHRSMEMTLIYARIADRVVADEYQAISEKIDALYGQELELPADCETTGMAKLRREAQARMLGNGLCTRPVELDCRMESACETCNYFQTSIEFRPTLRRQRDHAEERGQAERVAISSQRSSVRLGSCLPVSTLAVASDRARSLGRLDEPDEAGAAQASRKSLL
jgi:hypothetical protein